MLAARMLLTPAANTVLIGHQIALSAVAAGTAIMLSVNPAARRRTLGTDQAA